METTQSERMQRAWRKAREHALRILERHKRVCAEQALRDAFNQLDPFEQKEVFQWLGFATVLDRANRPMTQRTPAGFPGNVDRAMNTGGGAMHGTELTPRQVRVAQLVGRGYTNRAIADRHQIPYSATRNDLLQIRTKWRCDNRTQVAVATLRSGVAPLSDGPPLRFSIADRAPDPEGAFQPIDGAQSGPAPLESNEAGMTSILGKSEWLTPMYRRQLSQREEKVARLIARGFSNKEIAQQLTISMASVKRAAGNVLLQWRCVNRTEVALEALRRGVVQLAGAAEGETAASLMDGTPPSARMTAPDERVPADATSLRLVRPADS